MIDTRIVLVADDAFVRSGISAILAKQQSLTVVGEATSISEARKLGRRVGANLFVVDVTAFHLGMQDVVKQINDTTNVPVVLLTAQQSGSDVNALRQGHCVVLRSRTNAAELVAAIQMVAAGYIPVERSLARRLACSVAEVQASERGLTSRLTEREREIFQLIANGMSNPEIADTLIIARSTVKSHVQDILRKLRLRNRLEVVKYARELATSRTVAS